MSLTRRETLGLCVGGLTSAALLRWERAAGAAGKPPRFKVGVTDWNLKLEGKPESVDHVGDVLRDVAPAAEKAGVILGLEDTISARDNARIMGRTKSPAVLTYYDVGNSTKNGFNVVEEIRWLGGDRICEVHLKD